MSTRAAKRPRKAPDDPSDNGAAAPPGSARTQTKVMALSVDMLAAGGAAKKEIQRLVGVVTTACLRATRALELYARHQLEECGGDFPTDLNWCALVDQVFKMSSSTGTGPLHVQPGWSELIELWRDAGGQSGDLDLRGYPQALTFESQAYLSTLLKNYCHVALRAHVLSSLRFLWPEYTRAALERAFDWPAARAALPAALAGLIQRCLEIEAMPCKKGTVGQTEREADANGKRPARAAKAAVDKNKECIEAATRLRMQLLQRMQAVERWRNVKDRKTGAKIRIRVQPRQFNMFPHARQAGRFVTIDDRIAHSVLRRVRAETVATEKGALRRLFLLESKPLAVFERQRYLFPHTVKTNGVQANIPYEKYFDGAGVAIPPAAMTDALRRTLRRSMADETAESTADFSTATNGLFAQASVPVGVPLSPELVLGMDPGENNLVATSDGAKVSKEDFYAWRKPCKRAGLANADQQARRHAALARRSANRKLKRAEIEEAQRALMAAPMKTVDYNAFIVGLRVHNARTPALQAYYGSRTKLDERFRRYIRQQKGVQFLLGAVGVAPGSARVVAFGRAYTGRRARFGDSLPVAPVKMITRQLAKRCRVVLTTEHRSSKTHATCGHELDYGRAVGTERFTVCGGCGAVVERDLNAAVNIAAALVQHSVDGTPLPHLSRDPTARA